jgi:hypothetical protein
MKKEEIDELGPKTVFTIKHSDIPKGITQCVRHAYSRLSENEVHCVQCHSAWIVNPETVDELCR